MFRWRSCIGARNTGVGKSGYGRSKPGRPPANTEEERATPRCEKCRHMRVTERGKALCGHHLPLDPVGCPEFSSAAVQRALFFGGISGVGIAR